MSGGATLHAIYCNFSTLLEVAATQVLDERDLLNTLHTSSFNERALVVRDSLFRWGAHNVERVRAALQETHRSYHVHLKKVTEIHLPALQTLYRAHLQGQVTDSCAHVSARAVLDFFTHTRDFFKKVLERQNPWLTAIFEQYFCSGCLEGTTAIVEMSAILELESHLNKRLPFPLLAAFLNDQPYSRSDLDTFVEEVYKHRVPVAHLHLGLQGVRHLLDSPRPLSVLEETLENQSTLLIEKGKLEDEEHTVVLEPDPEHLAWREKLLPGATVTASTICQEGKDFFFCTTDYRLGKRLGAKDGDEFDRLIHFEIESAEERRRLLSSPSCDPMVLEFRRHERAPTQVQNCNAYIVSIAQNCAVFDLKQLVMQGVMNQRKSPFVHCNMGVPLAHSIDLRGRCAILQKLKSPTGPFWQALSTRLLEKLERLDFTPYPLHGKYVLQGTTLNAQGKEVHVVYYIKMTQRKDKDSKALAAFKESLSK